MAMQQIDSYTKTDISGDKLEFVLWRDESFYWEVSCFTNGTEHWIVGHNPDTKKPFTEAEAYAEFNRWRK